MRCAPAWPGPERPTPYGEADSRQRPFTVGTWRLARHPPPTCSPRPRSPASPPGSWWSSPARCRDAPRRPLPRPGRRPGQPARDSRPRPRQAEPARRRPRHGRRPDAPDRPDTLTGRQRHAITSIARSRAMLTDEQATVLLTALASGPGCSAATTARTTRRSARTFGSACTTPMTSTSPPGTDLRQPGWQGRGRSQGTLVTAHETGGLPPARRTTGINSARVTNNNAAFPLTSNPRSTETPAEEPGRWARGASQIST
jgi:hypothetical protein